MQKLWMIGIEERAPDRNAKALVREVIVIAGPACLKAEMKRVSVDYSSFC